MLIKAKTLIGYKLDSLDGEIGKVKDFYYDDLHWTIRYLVANAGNWLTDRQVLISPFALVGVNKEERNISVDLVKKQIEKSPSLDSDKPVFRQFEEAYYGHYGYPTYWGGPYRWGPYPYPMRDREQWKESIQSKKGWDLHLRSTGDAIGHHIEALNGEVGHVEDFVIDDETWAIRYIIVDTHNWLPGKKVLIATQWVERVSWDERKVFVNLNRQTIKESPAYTNESLLTRDYESKLYEHCDRKGYWLDEVVAG
jgi:PRC-barrel domain